MNHTQKICLIGFGQIYETITADLHAYAHPDTQWLFRPVSHPGSLEDCADSILSGIPEDASLFIAVEPTRMNYDRLELYGRAKARGLSMINLIHKAAYCSPDIILGDNIWIGAGVVIDYQAEIGDDVMISPMARIDPRVKIGNHCWIGRGASILSGATTGEHCTIGNDTQIETNINIGRECVILCPGLWDQSLPAGTFVERKASESFPPSRIIGEGYTFNTARNSSAEAE